MSRRYLIHISFNRQSHGSFSSFIRTIVGWIGLFVVSSYKILGGFIGIGDWERVWEMGSVSRMEALTLINTRAYLFAFSFTHATQPLFLSPTRNCPLTEVLVQKTPPLPTHTHTHHPKLIGHSLIFTCYFNFPYCYFYCCYCYDLHST